jgi:hypothetical protein
MSARIIAAAVAAMIAGTASAKDLIQCHHPSSDEVVISLNDRRMFGRMLNCISGSFVEDMTPCAPNGGYGLSYPTGTAGLAKIVDRWQDAYNHLGGVVHAEITSSTIRFDGSFNSPGTSSSEDDGMWTFEIDRITGSAELKMFGKPAIPYDCRLVKPKI